MEVKDKIVLEFLKKKEYNNHQCIITNASIYGSLVN